MAPGAVTELSPGGDLLPLLPPHLVVAAAAVRHCRWEQDCVGIRVDVHHAGRHLRPLLEAAQNRKKAQHRCNEAAFGSALDM